MKFFKMLCITVFLCALMTSLAACGSDTSKEQQPQPVAKSTMKAGDYPQEIIALAKMESASLDKTLPLFNQLKASCSSWDKGLINREQLAEELAPIFPKVKAMQDEYLKFRKDTNFAKTPAVQHEAYQEGLYQGEMIRSRIMHFIQFACIGYPAAKNISPMPNIPKLETNELKESYNNQIYTSCSKRIIELQDKLIEIEKSGALK